MGRNCYTKDDVEKFREAVVKYLVPVADKVYREQAKRLGKQYPMSFADNALEFRSGNPRPAGTPDDILAQGMKFYSELSPETKEFFETMLRDELLDVLSTEGKHDDAPRCGTRHLLGHGDQLTHLIDTNSHLVSEIGRAHV